MKPITFESIRNFLKTKKKNKKDGADASFKRSDSFKRISIRKSYLDRGRKRAIRTKAVIDFNEVDVKTGIYSGRPLVENKQFDGGAKEDFSLKNKSLQEINEICGGGEDGGNDKYNSVNAPNANAVDVDNRETETQTVAINFQGSNSTESIYNDLNNESGYEAENDEKKLNISQISVAASLNSKHRQSTSLNIIEEDVDTKSNISSNSYFLFDENIYEKADSIIKERSTNSNSFNGASNNQTVTSIDFDKQRIRYNSKSSLDKHSIKSSSSYIDSTNSVTFKTYCEPKTYIETSFDCVEPRSVTHSLESSRSNISRTSLNYEVVHTTGIDSQTFKKPGKNKNEGVVIRIPAISESDSDDLATTKTKQNLNKQISNDSALDITEDLAISNNLETSLNGKFTFEIYKELQRSKDNILKDKLRPDFKTEEFSEDRSNGKKISKRSKSKQAAGESLSPLATKSLDETFRSLQIDDKSENFFFEPEQCVYDEVNIISPDSSIPYPLRIKTNPFTRQKELYSVNLGRIWKQLNLGQEEDMSLEATSMQGNFKVKNESFKSMSSHDSGFSLTLTKPKNIFRRKSKKNRRKPKLSVSRDGYFKRVMVVQRNSSRRKKKKNTKQQQQHQLNNMFDQSFYETLDRYYQESRRYGNNYPVDGSKYYENDVFMREFEEFCMRRNQTRIEKYKSKSFDEFLQFNNDDDKFSQEISDLEAFFEEHLKRLKEYYLQKKQLNERTINELYHDYDRHGKQKEISPEEYKNDYEHRFYTRSNDSLNVQSDRNHLNTIENEPSSLEYTSFVYDDASLDFSFPHPDKRIGRNNHSKNRNKFRTQEVRPMASSNELKYASLEFTNVGQCDKKSVDNAVPYADIQFPREFTEFPYGKIQLNENRRTSRRRFKRLDHSGSKSKTEISLSAIFPSVSKIRKDICHRCHKERNNHSIKDNTDDILASDEFSENEFIANSIGCELCANCDNLYIDCVCSTNELDGSGKKVLFCKCSVDDEGGRKLTTTNKRKMKRKKSKRRLGKNHSTLRRGYSCTSEFIYFFLIYYFLFCINLLFL